MALKKPIQKAGIKPIKQADTYTKEQIISSEKYQDKKDIIDVIFKNDKLYSVEQADKLINKFMERKVK